jgi:hypothetical protein
MAFESSRLAIQKCRAGRKGQKGEPRAKAGPGRRAPQPGWRASRNKAPESRRFSP